VLIFGEGVIVSFPTFLIATNVCLGAFCVFLLVQLREQIEFIQHQVSEFDVRFTTGLRELEMQLTAGLDQINAEMHTMPKGDA